MADPGITAGGGGGGSDGSSEVEILESWDCSDAHDHIAYTLCFVVRSENEIHIVNIAYKLQLSMCTLLCTNLQNIPEKKNNRGGEWRRPVHRS